MRFEEAMIAMRQGHKVCRQRNVNRLNGVYYKMVDGHVKTFSVMNDAPGFCIAVSVSNLDAEDWQIYERVGHDKD